MGKIMQGKWLKNGKYKTNKDGTPWEQEIDDPSCLYKKDVIKIIGIENWPKFSEWMTGQGAPIMSDGTMGYFSHDVEKFKLHYIDGVPPLTRDEIAKIIDKSEISGTIGKMNTREWNSTRKGPDFKANQHKKSKDPSFHEGLKRNKWRWNKKKGKREKSKKGSRDRIYWAD